MFCGFPIEVGARLRPCGKCSGCLRRRRRAWVGRMLAESTQHQESCFITLTYRDEDLPLVRDEETDSWHPTLVKLHLQQFIRETRRQIRPWGMSLRYFACGEYGEKMGRPHYHLIAFGLGIGAEDCLKKWWKRGFVTVGTATPKSMSYVAKYCLKVSTQGHASALPPFRLMSLRPPIGAGFAANIADSLTTKMGSHVLSHGQLAIERAIKIGRDSYPLDNTMRNYVGKELAIPESMKDSIFRRDYPDQTDEETAQGRRQHIKAWQTRNSRTKL